VGEKKKEEKNKKRFLGNLFKNRTGGCCDVKFVPIEEDQQKNSGQEKRKK